MEHYCIYGITYKNKPSEKNILSTFTTKEAAEEAIKSFGETFQVIKIFLPHNVIAHDIE